jgi:phytoene synthase
MMMPQSAVIYAKPLPEVQFLVDAATEGVAEKREWSDKFFDPIQQLRNADAQKHTA